MCTNFTTDGLCMNTMCAVSLANHLRAVAGDTSDTAHIVFIHIPSVVKPVHKQANHYRLVIYLTITFIIYKGAHSL